MLMMCATSPGAGSLSQKGGVWKRRPLGQRLTRRRKPRGTVACRRSGSGPKTLTAGVRKDRERRGGPHCSNPSLQGCKRTSPDTASDVGATAIGRQSRRRLNLPRGGRWGMTPFKGADGAPTSRSRRPAPWEGGIARRAAQGDGAAVVLGGRESRPQGEGRQVF